jgi:2,3-bisphosphoglycerate-dependent phosphoglycerate mutase
MAGRRASELLAEILSTKSIAAIYSSPARRAVETVQPLSERLGVRTVLIPDLRERELPVVMAEEFDALVRRAWQHPDRAPNGGESNVSGQRRGMAVVRDIASMHVGQHIVVATHGNLLSLIVNGFDSSFGYDFWHGLSFPDVYRLDLADMQFGGLERVWQAT